MLRNFSSWDACRMVTIVLKQLKIIRRPSFRAAPVKLCSYFCLGSTNVSTPLKPSAPTGPGFHPPQTPSPSTPNPQQCGYCIYNNNSNDTDDNEMSATSVHPVLHLVSYRTNSLRTLAARRTRRMQKNKKRSP